MLGEQMIHPRDACTTWKVVQRRVAFAEGNNVAGIESGQQFAKAPHTAGIERSGGSPPIPPQTLQSFSGKAGKTGIENFQKIAAVAAAKRLLRLIAYRTASDAAQVRGLI